MDKQRDKEKKRTKIISFQIKNAQNRSMQTILQIDLLHNNNGNMLCACILFHLFTLQTRRDEPEKYIRPQRKVSPDFYNICFVSFYRKNTIF